MLLETILTQSDVILETVSYLAASVGFYCQFYPNCGHRSPHEEWEFGEFYPGELSPPDLRHGGFETQTTLDNYGIRGPYETKLDLPGPEPFRLPDPEPLKPAEILGIGGSGIAREMPGTSGLIERFRYDPGHPGLPEPHLNYEIIVHGVERKQIIGNFHIPDIPKIDKW